LVHLLLDTLGPGCVDRDAMQYDAIAYTKVRNMGVTFGGVTVHLHTRTVDSGKLPSDGVAPLGLGARVSTEEHTTIEDFEEHRRSRRDTNDPLVLWFHIPPAMRCELLEDDCSASELEAVARENAALLTERQERSESSFATGSASSETDSASSDLEREATRDVEQLVQYGTVRAGEKRDGVCGAFSEVQPEEEERRKQRALEAQSQKERRRAERKKCAGCHRFACIC